MTGIAPYGRCRPDYNPIARFYSRHWSPGHLSGLLRMLERLLLGRLRPGSRVLDVCCGDGSVAHALVRRGFPVTGIDGSLGMLRYAVAGNSGATFVAADARNFALAPRFEAAICTLDSLSYILDREDLRRVFSNVRRSLREGGRFVFDLSLESAYLSEWNRTYSVVEDDEACFVRGSYDRTTKIGRTLITVFSRKGSWERADVEFQARRHDPDNVLLDLERAGFPHACFHESDRDVELALDLGCGRACFVAEA
jgi:SAM-dependent methyltransferase